MAYVWDDNIQDFRWEGPETQPIIGQTKAEYLATPGSDPDLTGVIKAGVAIIPVIAGAAAAVGGMLFGDIGGDNGGQAQVGGLPFDPRGPGVPEPPQAMVAKAWKIKATRSGVGGILGEITGQNEWWVFFWRLIDGRTVMYNPMKRQWKMWRDYKSITIGKAITTANAKRVAKRFKQHVKALSTVMRIVK